MNWQLLKLIDEKPLGISWGEIFTAQGLNLIEGVAVYGNSHAILFVLFVNLEGRRSFISGLFAFINKKDCVFGPRKCLIIVGGKMADSPTFLDEQNAFECSLPGLLAGDIPTFDRVFGRGVEWRLSRAGQSELRTNCEKVIQAAAKEAESSASGENLAFHDVAAIVNRHVKRISGAGSPNSVESRDKRPGNALAVERGLQSLALPERDALLGYYVDHYSEEVVCRESGLSIKTFRALRSRFRIAYSENIRPKPARFQSRYLRKPGHSRKSA